MDKTELRLLQADFEKRRNDLKKHFKSLEQLRRQFVKDFSVAKIEKLKIDEYIIGKGSYDSFCYRIENELNALGNIHGSTSKKFGIWYGTLGDDKTEKYRIGKQIFGKKIDTAFINIKTEIINLIEAGNKNGFKSIRVNPISPMFKGKILALYYPAKYLSTYSGEYLDYFINHLGLNSKSNSEIDKQKLLVDFKNRDIVMKPWSLIEYNAFLYHSFNRPGAEKEKNAIHPELRSYWIDKLPPIEKTHGEYIELTFSNFESPRSSNKKSVKKPDYSKQDKINKTLGDRGELIVQNAEIKWLEKNNYEHLSKEVKRVSEDDDRLGYDILSFDSNSKKCYIEVKSTRSKPGSVNFIITSNELEKAKKLKNYKIYIVFEVHTLKPKIWDAGNPFKKENKRVRLSPINYRVQINTKSK